MGHECPGTMRQNTGGRPLIVHQKYGIRVTMLWFTEENSVNVVLEQRVRVCNICCVVRFS